MVFCFIIYAIIWMKRRPELDYYVVDVTGRIVLLQKGQLFTLAPCIKPAKTGIGFEIYKIINQERAFETTSVVYGGRVRDYEDPIFKCQLLRCFHKRKFPTGEKGKFVFIKGSVIASAVRQAEPPTIVRISLHEILCGNKKA
jgi:hypothetical protein